MQQCVLKRSLVTALLAATAWLVGGHLAAQTFATLYNFTGGADGAQPFAGLTLSGNTLYGTTLLDGSSGDGSVFAFTSAGAGFSTLYGFNGLNDGHYAQGALVCSGGSLYGTTHLGSAANNGTVFAVNLDGSGFNVIYAFSAVGGPLPYQTNSDGANPQAGLVLSAGTLYGSAVNGGSQGYGTVFAVNTDGTGYRVLHTFTAVSSVGQTNRDGANPYGGLVLSGSTLFGTTHGGGAAGRGAVFSVNTDGTAFKALHSFSGTLDGGNPLSGLALSGNSLYGTTVQGGSSGQGTLFTLKTDGSGFVVLHSFSGPTDGANPAADLIVAGSTLYGTATYGGTFSNGTVFAIQTNGTAFTNLHSFTATSGQQGTNSDGAKPYARLLLSGNTLYGTATAGGSFGLGSIFSVSVGPVTPPSLAVTLSGTNVVLTWPTGAAGFILQSSTNLAAPALWTDVSTPPVVVNGINAVTNPVSGRSEFYRLSLH